MLKIAFDAYPKSKDGLHYLKNKDIEDYAELVLLDYNPELLETPQPINWEDFLENYLKCDVDYAHIAKHPNGEDILGACSFDDDMALPIYNEELDRTEVRKLKTGDIVLHTMLGSQPKRLRFTALHEGGHWALHQPYYFSLNQAKGQISFFTEPEEKPIKCCRKSDIERPKGNYRNNLTTAEHLERQANVFAAAIAVPHKALQKIIPALFNKFRFTLIKENAAITTNISAKMDAIIKEVSSTFGVSEQVSSIKLDQLEVWYEKNDLFTVADEQDLYKTANG